MYDYGYFNPEPVIESSLNGTQIWIVVSIVLAIVGGIVGYFLFIKPEVEVSNKYLKWAQDFFNFKKMVIEDLLKVLYIISAIYITLSSLTLLTTDFMSFVLVLIVGNVLLRLAFEGMLVLIMIWKNTNDINNKINAKSVTTKKKETKETK